ncbi:MAG: hypothetical protein LKE52_00660 [Bacilli bacterium]|jgi:hypothetical protein|nr:hypothetical protein [Bacilli bacterium]
MKNTIRKNVVFFAGLAFLSTSCAKAAPIGKIVFVLGDGESFAEGNAPESLSGEANTPIFEGLPEAKKDGFYFLGWREKNNKGKYQTLVKHPYTGKEEQYKGQDFYYYPYSTDKLYAYFEPLETLTFDLNTTDPSAVLVAPSLGASDFSATAKTLSGYSTKKISSTSYLPTATATHMSFSSWALDYPIQSVSRESSTSGTAFTYMNVTGTKGTYAFDKAFEEVTQGAFMVFPEIEDGTTNITLKAIWTEDPTITVHMGVEGVSDVQFQAKNEVIKEQIFSAISSSFTDYTEETVGDVTYTYVEGKKKRLEGIYLDSGLTSPFRLESMVGEKDLDLYVNWNNEIEVVFDYNGGKIGDKETDSYFGYEGDKIPVPSAYPTKKDAYFLYYTNNDVRFDFLTGKLPDTDMTLKAVYANDPTLTVSYDYPDGYSQEKAEEKSFVLTKDSDLSVPFGEMESRITDASLQIDGFYDGDSLFVLKKMPATDTVLTLRLSYKALVTLKTVSAPDASSGVLASDITAYCGTDIVNADIDSLQTGLEDDLVKEGTTYIFEGYYSTSSLAPNSKRADKKFSGSSSRSEVPSLTLYRYMKEAITLTFQKEDGTSLGSVKVLPSSTLYDGASTLTSAAKRIKALLGVTDTQFASLTFKVGTETIGNILPGVSSTITVSGL